MSKDRLDIAIEQFEDESLDLTLGERVSILRQALTLNAFEALKRVKKHGSKSVISEEEEYKQVECMKHFKVIEQMYACEIKMSKLTGKTSDRMTSEFMDAIKKMKGSVGEIITTIPT